MDKVTSNVIAFFALLVALLTAYYTKEQIQIAKEQTQIAKQSYEAAIAQVNAANRATDLASEQLGLQKKTLESENQYSVVIGNEDELRKALSNGQNIKFSLSNASSKPVGYQVIVKSTGIGLYFIDQNPNEMLYAIRLDERPILIKPNDTYQGAFTVWHGQRKSAKAKISIFVNGELVDDYNYMWDEKSSKYLPK
jgi:hypothetical protein